MQSLQVSSRILITRVSEDDNDDKDDGEVDKLLMLELLLMSGLLLQLLLTHLGDAIGDKLP